MAKAKGKRGRKPIHRLLVMGNIEAGGRVIAAVPAYKGVDEYIPGLSIQRLHGPTFQGQAGFVLRMLGKDGTLATMVVRSGQDPTTVTFEKNGAVPAFEGVVNAELAEAMDGDFDNAK